MSAGIRGQKQTVINLPNFRTEDRIQKHQTQKQLLEIIKQKNHQITILNQLNSRIGQQLYKLQKKLGIDPELILKQLQEANEISVAFHYETQQLQYLDSLLIAYDENNIKQKKLIAHLYNSLEDAEKKTENLVSDNQFLLAEMQEKCKQILQIYSKGFPEQNLVAAYAKLQRETEVDLLESIREENQYISRHYRDAQIKISTLEDELKQAKRNSEQHFKNFKNSSTELTQASVQLDDLIKIKQILEKKLGEITEDNIDLQSAREQLLSKVSKLQGEFKILRNQYQTHRKNNRQEIERVNSQFQSLKIESQSSEKRQRQFFNKNMILEKQVQSLKDDCRLLKRELEQTKADWEQTLKMCEAYENKLINFNKKQILNKQTLQDCKQRLDNAILDKQKAELKEKQLQKLIGSLKQKNREQFEAFKNNYQKIIASQNQKTKFLEEQREDMQSGHHQNQCSSKHQIQKLKRENAMLKEQNEKHIKSIRTNSGNEIITRLKDLEDKNQNLNRLITQKQRTYRQDIDHKDEILRNLENQNRDLSRQIDKERASVREIVNERTQYKSKISILQKQKQCLQEQISKLKRSFDSKVSNQLENRTGRVKQLQEKLKQVEKEKKDIKKKTIEMLEKYDQSEEELKKQYQITINQLSAQNTRLKQKITKR